MAATDSSLKTDLPIAREETTHEEAPPVPPTGDECRECAVCSYDMRPGEDLLSCPHCGARAHRSHFLEWAKIKRSCPNCHERLEQADFE